MKQGSLGILRANDWRETYLPLRSRESRGERHSGGRRRAFKREVGRSLGFACVCMVLRNRPYMLNSGEFVKNMLSIYPNCIVNPSELECESHLLNWTNGEEAQCQCSHNRSPIRMFETYILSSHRLMDCIEVEEESEEDNECIS
jgi:hypothetical protein